MGRQLEYNQLLEIITQAQKHVEKMIHQANRNHDLEAYLRRIGMDSLWINPDDDEAEREIKILVLGETRVGESLLRQIATDMGFGSNQIDYCLDYREIKRFDFSSLRKPCRYTYVLVGPMAHKQKGIDSSRSAIAEMESKPEEYPIVIRLTDRTGSLSISATSFQNGLLDVLPNK